jgi:hypothetical protein
MVYLNLLRQNIELHGVALIGYCLMSNHVHLVVIPHNGCGLALALKETHGRYAAYWNTLHRSSGHAWQGRYFPVHWTARICGKRCVMRMSSGQGELTRDCALHGRKTTIMFSLWGSVNA